MKIIRRTRQRWVFVIEPLGSAPRSLGETTDDLSKTVRDFVGPDSEIHVTTYLDGSFSVQVRTDNPQPIEPLYIVWMTQQWRAWATRGWGFGTKVTCVTAELERDPRASPLVGSA